MRSKAISTIKASDIADTYLISRIYDRSSEYKNLFDFRLEEIRQSYLRGFTELFITQLMKYSLAERIDQHYFHNHRINENSDFVEAFTHTYRSDRKRVNYSWVKIAETVQELKIVECGGTRLIQVLDKINHTLHNGTAFTITKFKYGTELVSILRTKFSEPTERLFKYCSRDVKRWYINETNSLRHLLIKG